MSQGDEADLFRTRVLVWNLDRLEGRAALPVEPPRVAIDWTASEAWFAARALPAGAARCEAMLLALDAAAPSELASRVDVAEGHAREELLAADPYAAAQLAARVDAVAPTAARFALHARAVAQAGDLRAGRASDVGSLDLATQGSARADAVAGSPDEAVVRCALARLALARGDVVAARGAIGAALARSSGEAAVLAGRLLVDGDEPRRARVLARAWIGDADGRDVPSALWALACLAETQRAYTGGAPFRPTPPVR